MPTVRADDPVALALVEAIRGGDLRTLTRLLDETADLANARIVNAKGVQRTPLHVAADWPGYFSNGPATVELLIARGADPNAPVLGGSSSEPPLHWAARSDDVEVAQALIDGGADIEAMGASIAGGTPLDDAVGYGCWQVARLLVECGARVQKLWHAAALGLVDSVVGFLGADPPPSQTELNDAFWQACHGGQRRVAELLYAHGADVNWIPNYSKWTPVEVATIPDTGRQALVDWLRAEGDHRE